MAKSSPSDSEPKSIKLRFPVINEALLVGAITIFSYASVFFYSAGNYFYYGIPRELVDLNLLHVFITLLIVTVACLAVIVMIVTTLIIGLTVVNFVIVSLPSKLLVSVSNVRVRSIDLTWRILKPNWKLAITVYAIVVWFMIAYFAGFVFAQLKRNYLVSSSDKNCVVITISSDSYVCSEYDANTHKITQNFVIHRNDRSNEFHSVELGLRPWPPKLRLPIF